MLRNTEKTTATKSRRWFLPRGRGRVALRAAPGDSKPSARARLTLGTDLQPTQGASNSPTPDRSLRTCHRTCPGGGRPEDAAGTVPRVHPEGPASCKRPQVAVTPVPASMRTRPQQPLWKSDAASSAAPSLPSPAPARILARHPRS